MDNRTAETNTRALKNEKLRIHPHNRLFPTRRDRGIPTKPPAAETRPAGGETPWTR
jgi:hypothetical protein